METKKPNSNFKTDASFWEQLWRTNQTGWDMGMVSPPIKAYIDTVKNKNLRILIPGCGNTYEAEYLLQNGFINVTVVDISSTLTEKLKRKFADSLNQSIQIICSDFFDLKGEYDLILEQTFFCTLPLELRSEYVAKMYELLSPGGELVGLLFNKKFETEGPPFGGTAEEYKKLFNPLFTFKTFDACYNSHPARSGVELFIHLVKK